MNHLTFSKHLSIGLLAIGTAFMVVYVLTLLPVIALAGYMYTGLATLVGIIYLFVLVNGMARKTIDTKTGLQSIGMLTVNIPVALLYAYLVMILLNTVRVTFVNETGQDLSSVAITGCEQERIEFLGKGKSTTRWINIPGDCSLDIHYQLDGIQRSEVVSEYLTGLAGHKTTHRIGAPPYGIPGTNGGNGPETFR